jgi:hypothetical protein
MGVAMVLAAAMSVRAEDVIIRTPVSVSAKSFYNASYSPDYTINGSGLTGTGRLATHTNANAANLFWHSASGLVTNEYITFDLGESCHVTNALIWQLAQVSNTNRGVRTFTIAVAGPDYTFTTLSTNNTLAIASGSANEPVQVVPLLAGGIRYVRFWVESNYGSADMVGLSEVRFEILHVEPYVREQVTIAPRAATASTFYNSSYSPDWMIDGSGLKGGFGREATHTNANVGNVFWHSNTGIIVSNQWVEFDLGLPYHVTNALVWNLGQANLSNRGVKDFTIKVAGADYQFTTLSTGNRLAQAATDGVQVPVQVVPLLAENVRYVRFNIESNWGASGIVGLSEVRFEVLHAEPHPTAMVLCPAFAAPSSRYSSGEDFSGDGLLNGTSVIGTGRDARHLNTGDFKTFWHSNTGTVIPNQWVEFDLGGLYDVTNALVWQLTQTSQSRRGIKRFTVQVAGYDHAFTTFSTNNALFIAQVKSDYEPVQVVPLGATGVRYVRFNVETNWGAGDVVGLGEVRFEVAPVPALNTNGTLRLAVTNAASSAFVNNPPRYLIDGSGLTGSGLAATHTNGLGQTSMWLSETNNVINEWVEFDLGAEVDLLSGAVWQYNQTRAGDGSEALANLLRGARALTIYTAGSSKSYTEYGAARLAKGTGTASEPAQFIRLEKQGVRYVKFGFKGNCGENNDRVGLSEVRFIYKKRNGTLILVN